MSHLEALKILQGQFPDLAIGSLCSGYTKSELQQIRALGVLVKSWKQPRHKYEKHNWILAKLFQRKNQSLCLLDDDVSFLDESVSFIRRYVTDPSCMEAPCYYCAPKGLLMGMYLLMKKSTRPDVAKAPLGVAGWMTLVRSDLGVLYDKELVLSDDGRSMADDLTFRCQCAAVGQQVLLDKRIVMTTTCTQRFSYVADNIELRREWMKKARDKIIQRYPYLLHSCGSQFRFIWSTRYAAEMLSRGFLRRTKYGYEISQGSEAALLEIFGKKAQGFFQ